MRVQLHGWFGGFDDMGRELGAYDAAGYMYALRDLRDILLKECDFTQASDISFDDETKQAWTEFRQALRDFPAQFTVDNITPVVEFPEPPVIGRPRTWRNIDPDVIAERTRAQVTSGDVQ